MRKSSGRREGEKEESSGKVKLGSLVETREKFSKQCGGVVSPRERAPGRSIANAGQSYRRNRKGHMVGRPIVVIDWVKSPKLGELRFSESENVLEPVKGGVKGER